MPTLFRPSLALAALLAASLVAAADDAGVAPPTTPAAATETAPAAAPTAVLEQRVEEFLQAFIDPDQSPEEQARLFVEGADYYRFGPTSRRDIAADIRRYARRWPERSYRLLAIEYLQHDPSSDDVFVSYVIEYEVANDRARARGIATYGAGITDIHSTPKVSMIMERIRSQ